MGHYKIGQKIGDFTISSFNKKGIYTLTCKCGATSSGDATHITRKISNIMAEGFSACQRCSSKYRKEFKLLQFQTATIYTYKDVYREYVKKSKEREINFELSLEGASKLFNQNCTYCNRPPSNLRKRDSGIEVYYQGLDRVNNNLGYITSNVVPCCKYCNSFKSNRNLKEFEEHLDELLKMKVQRLERKLVDSSESKWESPLEEKI